MRFLSHLRRASYRFGRRAADAQALARQRRIPARLVNKTIGRNLRRLWR